MARLHGRNLFRILDVRDIEAADPAKAFGAHGIGDALNSAITPDRTWQSRNRKRTEREQCGKKRCRSHGRTVSGSGETREQRHHPANLGALIGVDIGDNLVQLWLLRRARCA